MTIEVICIGEILIDITPLDLNGYREGIKLEAHIGGAPANVAVGVARLGHSSAFVGAIGDDPFGKMIIDFLAKNNVNIKWLIMKKARTSLAFVVLYGDGEREFFFYRKPWIDTADTMLTIDDIDINDILDTKIIHISGVALAYPPLSETIYMIMFKAFKKGVLTSMDPNYRNDIWGSGEKSLKALNRVLRMCRIITMGRDELINIFRSEDYKAIAKRLFNSYPNLEIIAIRLGTNGAYVAKRSGEEAYVPAFKITPIDTTGAGDAWTAAFISTHILEEMDLEKSIIYSNAVAAIKCTRRGASSSPYRDEVEKFLRENYAHLD